MRVEEELERPKAAHHVLGRVRAVDPQHEELRSRGGELLLQREDSVADRELVELGRVHRQGPSGYVDAAAVVVDRPLLEIAVGADEVDARAQEVLPPAVVWKPIRSQASSPSWIARLIGLGSTCQ